MKIAFERRNTSNNSEITQSFLQNRGNGRIFRTLLLISTRKTVCIAFSVLNAMEIAFKRRNISNNIEITRSFLQNRVSGRIFLTVWLVSTLKTVCIAFGVLNTMEIAFKRRNISNNIEITHSFLQNRSNGRILRTRLLLSRMKLACVALGV